MTLHTQSPNISDMPISELKPRPSYRAIYVTAERAYDDPTAICQ